MHGIVAKGRKKYCQKEVINNGPSMKARYKNY